MRLPINPNQHMKMFRRFVNKEKPFNVQPAFSSLGVIVTDFSRTKHDVSADLLTSYLQIPSLRKFCGQGFITSDDDIGLQRLAQLETASSSITHLEFRACRLSIGDLANVLRACKCLKTFIFDLGGKHPNCFMYDGLGLRDALLWNKRSLENLWIDDGTFPSLTTTMPLLGFKTLKNIQVGMLVLFGRRQVGGYTWNGVAHEDQVDLAKLLPVSTESISFMNTYGRTRELTSAIGNWLKQKHTSHPNLKRIALEVFDHKEEFSWLNDVAHGAAVKIDRLNGTPLPTGDDWSDLMDGPSSPTANDWSDLLEQSINTREEWSFSDL